MIKKKPSIEIPVDLTNPGQFFACCGLLELADRLWRGAEAWFSEDRHSFCISCDGSLEALLIELSRSTIQSSLSTLELKRLGTLLSAEKSKLTPQSLAEKSRLQEKWKLERLYVSEPFSLWLDWWRDGNGERTELKTWAAKQLVADMAIQMLSVVRIQVNDFDTEAPNVFMSTKHNSLPFYFDSDLCRTGTARDAGFSADTLGLNPNYRPLLELLAFFGFQRFHPATTLGPDRFAYATWCLPLSPMIAAVVAANLVSPLVFERFSFELFARTKYMKAFLPAQPFSGV